MLGVTEAATFIAKSLLKKDPNKRRAYLQIMVSIAIARQSALSLPEVEEKSHFLRPDFRIRNKIFFVPPRG